MWDVALWEFNINFVDKVAIPIVFGLAGGIVWLVERRDKIKQEKRHTSEANRLRHEIGELTNHIKTSENEPAQLVVPYLQNQIQILEDQKARLEQELELVREALRRLQSNLEKIYQKSKRPIKDLPGAANEERTYKDQIVLLTNHLDKVRSSIVNATLVSTRFAEKGFDGDNQRKEIDQVIAKFQLERNLAGASVAKFIGAEYVKETAAKKAESHRKTVARARAKEIAMAKASNAHLMKKELD